jgi:hypothetical protein
MPLLHLNDVVRDDSNRSYRVTRRLGEGQFAEVWEVRLPGTDLHVSDSWCLQECSRMAADHPSVLLPCSSCVTCLT